VDLDIVMVNVWEHVDSRKEAMHFCGIHNINGTVLIDTGNEYVNRLGITGVPFNLVVDKKGIIRAAGMTTPDEVKATLMRLLLPFGA
jgi:hypothetical protein